MKAVTSYRPVVWYVAFTRDAREYFFDWLSPPGFRHCFCFAFCARANAWVIYDASLNGVEVSAIPAGAEMARFYEGLLDRKATILRYRTKGRPMGWRSRLFFSCVTGVKQVTGLRSGALRPIGLMRDLLADGAEIVFLRGRPHEGQAARGRSEDEGRPRTGGTTRRTAACF